MRRRWWLLLLGGLLLVSCNLPVGMVSVTPGDPRAPLGSPTWTPLPPAAPTATFHPPEDKAASLMPTAAFTPTVTTFFSPSPVFTETQASSATPAVTPTAFTSPTPKPTFTPWALPTFTAIWTWTPTVASPAPSPTATLAPPPTATPVVTSTATPLPLPSATATPSPLPPTATSPPPTATPWPPTPTATTAACAPQGQPGYEDQLLALINQERQNQGLAPLSMNAALREAARAHSRDMACQGFFSHTGSDGSSPADRVARYGYQFSYLGENIYAGNGPYNSPQAAFQAWMNSPGHRQNILSPNFVHVGIGYAYDPNSPYGSYWTADFGSP